MRFHKIFPWLAAALFFLAPAQAQASLSDYLSKAEGDPTYKMLGQLFGDVPGVLAGSPSPLSEILLQFNVAVFVVAILLVLYGVLTGLAATATEGKFLGQKQSSVWYPIRVIYGIFGLIPLFGGYSFPQALMILGMVVGVGIGNVTWDAGWKFMLGHVDSLVLANPEAAGKDETLEALISAQVCAIEHNLQQKKDAQEGKPQVLFLENGQLVKQGSISKLVFGAQADGYFVDSCGGVQVFPPPLKRGFLDGRRGAAALPPFDDQTVAAAQAQALQNMSAALHPYSLSLAVDGQAPDPTALAAIKNLYTQQVTTALAKASMESKHGFAQYMQQEGSSWLYAGSIFLKMVSINRDIQNAAGADITSIPAREGGIIEQGISNAAGIFAGWAKSVKNFVTADAPKIFGDAMESAGVRAAMEVMTGGEGDLLTGITRLGYSLSVASGIGLSLLAGVATIAGGDAMQILGLPAIFKLLFVIGIALSFFLPFLPFILWYSAVVSYGIVCIEAVFGAALWMLAHLETEGEGMGQKTAHGYLFLLNVIFRPVLMVSGLIGGWMLVNILGELLKYSLSVVYGSSPFAFSGWASVGGFIATLIIFSYLSYLLISRCFSLIHHLPNEVLAWVGGHIGKIGGDEDSRVFGALYAGGREMGHGLGGGGSKGRPGGGGDKGNTISPVGIPGGNTIRPDGGGD